MTSNGMLATYNPENVWPELNDIKYLSATGFIQFCFVLNVYIIKLIWNKLDYILELDQLANSNTIDIRQRIIESDIEKFIKKTDCPTLSPVEI